MREVTVDTCRPSFLVPSAEKAIALSANAHVATCLTGEISPFITPSLTVHVRGQTAESFNRLFAPLFDVLDALLDFLRWHIGELLSPGGLVLGNAH